MNSPEMERDIGEVGIAQAWSEAPVVLRRAPRGEGRRAALFLPLMLVALIFACIAVVHVARQRSAGPDSPSLCIGSSLLLFGTTCPLGGSRGAGEPDGNL